MRERSCQRLSVDSATRCKPSSFSFPPNLKISRKACSCSHFRTVTQLSCIRYPLVMRSVRWSCWLLQPKFQKGPRASSLEILAAHPRARSGTRLEGEELWEQLAPLHSYRLLPSSPPDQHHHSEPSFVQAICYHAYYKNRTTKLSEQGCRQSIQDARTAHAWRSFAKCVAFLGHCQREREHKCSCFSGLNFRYDIPLEVNACFAQEDSSCRIHLTSGPGETLDSLAITFSRSRKSYRH